MTHINIELPDELHKKAKITCAIHGKSLKEYIIIALEEKLLKEKNKLN